MQNENKSVDDRLNAIEGDIAAIKERIRSNRKKIAANTWGSIAFAAAVLAIGLKIEVDATGVHGSYGLPIVEIGQMLLAPALITGLAAFAPLLSDWIKKHQRDQNP